MLLPFVVVRTLIDSLASVAKILLVVGVVLLFAIEGGFVDLGMIEDLLFDAMLDSFV